MLCFHLFKRSSNVLGTNQARAKQARATPRPGRPEQGRPGPSRTGPGRPRPGMPGPGKLRLGRPRPNHPLWGAENIAVQTHPLFTTEIAFWRGRRGKVGCKPWQIKPPFFCTVTFGCGGMCRTTHTPHLRGVHGATHAPHGSTGQHTHHMPGTRWCTFGQMRHCQLQYPGVCGKHVSVQQYVWGCAV